MSLKLRNSSLVQRTVELDGTDLADGAKLLLIGAPIFSWVFLHQGVSCPLRTATGVPCPLCGLTTSIHDVMHANIASSLRINPFGIILLISAVTVVIRRPAKLTMPLLVPIVAALLSWTWQLNRLHLL